jgi:hypothetical protein
MAENDASPGNGGVHDSGEKAEVTLEDEIEESGEFAG